jgi:hypothetical protein
MTAPGAGSNYAACTSDKLDSRMQELHGSDGV